VRKFGLATNAATALSCAAVSAPSNAGISLLAEPTRTWCSTSSGVTRARNSADVRSRTLSRAAITSVGLPVRPWQLAHIVAKIFGPSTEPPVASP
jgi:hypothetical protein